MKFKEVKEKYEVIRGELFSAIQNYFNQIDTCAKIHGEGIILTFIKRSEYVSQLDNTHSKFFIDVSALSIIEEILGNPMAYHCEAKLITYSSIISANIFSLDTFENFNAQKNLIKVINNYQNGYPLDDTTLDNHGFELLVYFNLYPNENHILQLFGALKKISPEKQQFGYNDLTLEDANNMYIHVKIFFNVRLHKLF